MRFFVRALACAVPVLLTGCTQLEGLREGFDVLAESISSKDNAQPPTPLKDIVKPRVVRVLWEARVGDGFDARILDLTPALDGARLVVASHDGRVEAFDRATGRRQWVVKTGHAISGGVGLNATTVAYGTRDAEVVALDASSGARRWLASVSSEVLANPKILDGVVVARTVDGRITALDEASGARRWAHERGVPALSLRVPGSPAVIEHVVVDGGANGKLTALDARDGKIVWESVVSRPKGRSEIDRLVDLSPEPAVEDEEIFVAGYNSGVAALSARSGEVLWRQEDFSVWGGVAATPRALFLVDDDSDVWRLDLRNGADLWRQGDLHGRQLTTPLVYRDWVVVGDLEGYVHFLAQDDGRVVARTQVGSRPIGPRLVADGAVVYVYGTDGALAALTLE